MRISDWSSDVCASDLIEDVEIVNVTGVRSVREEATMLTQDENIVDVELSVQYRVSNVEEYVFQIVDPDLTLKQATKAAERQVVGQSKMEFILTDGLEDVGDATKQRGSTRGREREGK